MLMQPATEQKDIDTSESCPVQRIVGMKLQRSKAILYWRHYCKVCSKLHNTMQNYTITQTLRIGAIIGAIIAIYIQYFT